MSCKARIGLCCILSLLAWALEGSVQNQGTGGEPTTGQTVYVRDYTNPVYGYRVLIPAGLKAVGNAAPNPNHGVEIRLPESDASVFVDGHYTDDTLDDAVKAIIVVDRETCGRLINFHQNETRLGDLKAIRVEYDCLRPRPGFNVRIIARRLAHRHSPMLYEIGLETQQTGEQKDHALEVLEKIRSQFEVLPLN